MFGSLKIIVILKYNRNLHAFQEDGSVVQDKIHETIMAPTRQGSSHFGKSTALIEISRYFFILSKAGFSLKSVKAFGHVRNFVILKHNIIRTVQAQDDVSSAVRVQGI